MTSPRSRFGGAKIGFKGEYEYITLDEEKPTVPFRIFPAMHSLSAEGIWNVYVRQHFGYRGINQQDKSKTQLRTFACIEDKNSKTEMIEVSCPECRNQETHQQMLEDRKATLVNEAKGRGILEESAIERYCEPLLAEMIKWKKEHNTDGKYLLNAVTADGKLAVVKLPYKAFKALEAKIKEYRSKGLEPITDFDAGLYFVVQRHGKWSNATFEANAYVESGSTPGNFQIKFAPVSDDVLEKALKNLPDLSKLTRRLSKQQIQLLVESSGDPEEVDTIFNMSQRREASPSSLPAAQEAPAPVAPPSAAAQTSKLQPQAAAPTPAPATAPVVDADQLAMEAMQKQMQEMQAKMAAKKAPAPAPAASSGIPNPMDPSIKPEDFAKMFPAKLPPR